MEITAKHSLSDPRIIALLNEHLDDMRAISPPESVHALDLEALQAPSISFFSAWDQNNIMGCGAYKKHNATHFEIKSMRVAPFYRRQGVAKALLQYIIEHAEQAGATRLSLETGSMPFFDPAHCLYQSFGFENCPPFADYTEDIHSIFMTRMNTK